MRVLVQIMASCLSGDKPLCEPVMAMFTDTASDSFSMLGLS